MPKETIIDLRGISTNWFLKNRYLPLRKVFKTVGSDFQFHLRCDVCSISTFSRGRFFIGVSLRLGCLNMLAGHQLRPYFHEPSKVHQPSLRGDNRKDFICPRFSPFMPTERSLRCSALLSKHAVNQWVYKKFRLS